MTNKEIVKEIIWLAATITVSYILALLLLPSSTVYLSDIYVGSLPVSDFGAKSSWLFSLTDKATNPLTFLLTLFFLFPVVFVVNSSRALLKKFASRPFNLFLLFITFISILISLLFLYVYEPIALMMTSSWTIYPPLSSAPEFTTTQNMDAWFYCILAFVALQLLVLIVTLRKIFKKQS